jgi:hypothetical protein
MHGQSPRKKDAVWNEQISYKTKIFGDQDSVLVWKIWRIDDITLQRITLLNNWWVGGSK